MIVVDTSAYQKLHGREPHGSGVWAFRATDKRVVVNTSGRFSVAAAFAKKVASEHGATEIEVIP